MNGLFTDRFPLHLSPWQNYVSFNFKRRRRCVAVPLPTSLATASECSCSSSSALYHWMTQSLVCVLGLSSGYVGLELLPLNKWARTTMTRSHEEQLNGMVQLDLFYGPLSRHMCPRVNVPFPFLAGVVVISAACARADRFKCQLDVVGLLKNKNVNSPRNRSRDLWVSPGLFLYQVLP